ncbi:UNVERIFIED_CONTAM: RNA-dependent ATPase [Siphonaria sp. JEL0065]|nr:RNA-dependent ATPase [Siphonaria sp. JEL0065]
MTDIELKKKKKKRSSDDVEEQVEAVEPSEKKAKKEKKHKKAKVEEAEIATPEADHGKKDKKKKKKLASDNLSEFVADAVAASDAKPAAASGIWKYKQSEATAAYSDADVATFLEANAIAIGNLDNKNAKPVMKFEDANFPQKMEEILKEFPKPTFIQSVTWPPILHGRDLVGIAATGSGKTIAFGIPAMLHIMNKLASTRVSGSPKRKIQALIMSPTRELAMQIQETFEKFSAATGLTSVCLYGGASKYDQKQLLRQGPDIVVATPGRLIDFMGESECDLSDVGFFVLDEADRMLDLGFEPNIKEIAAAIKNKERQTVMFSATWPQSVMQLSQKYLKNPVHITVGSKDLSANTSIEQRVEVLADNRAKEGKLIQLLKDYHKSRKNRIMIFALYKKEAARLEQFVRNHGYNANAIHGDLTQDKRTAAIASFKDGTCPLLIATDVAARGIDIPNVEYVINYTYPLTTEDYCHRIGRTGRAGNKGIAHTFFTVLDKAHSGALINVLKQAKQKVPEELMKFGTTVKKKLDSNYGAFVKDIDPTVKATKITFGDDDD